jgi:signal transduction histidine kinase
MEKFYFFFQGIMFFQVAFFGMVYFISGKKDVLYYTLLNLISGIYFLLNSPNIFLGIDERIVFSSAIYLCTNFVLFLSMIFVYLLFLKEIFSDTVEQYPYVRKVYYTTFYIIPSLYLLFVVFSFLGWQTNAIFYVGHLINGPFCILILILNYKEKGYKSLVIYSMFITFFCIIVTVILTIRYNAGSNDTVLDKYPLAVIKMGMLIDIILFQLALLKRWNDREKELATQQLESQLAVEKVRNQISKELHDDIGATLSGISMYSYMAQAQSAAHEPLQVNKSLLVMQQSIQEMISSLNDIVWSINPRRERLQNLFEKLEEYAFMMAGSKNMQVQVGCSSSLQQINLPIESRHNIYLLLKEAINNAVKYSDGTMLQLMVKETGDQLEISVGDNGKGFDVLRVKRGNGLENMQKRADGIGAKLTIQSGHSAGCTVALQIKIT